VPDPSPLSPASDRSLAGRTIVAIFAHPDDESLACGGTLARLADAGARVVLFCASRGEKGPVADPTLVPDGDLGRAREAELREAAAVLGISEIIITNHGDGTLHWSHMAELRAQIVDLIQCMRPDAVITFAEDGLYWHLDHIGIYERTCEAFSDLADAPALYYVTMPTGAMKEMVDAVHEKGVGPPDSSLWGMVPEVFGIHSKPPTVIVDVKPWAARKLAALRCHRTQIGPSNPLAWIDEDQARQWLGVEQFRRSPLGSTADGPLEALGNGAC
jgi:LmbE family N-acetylglucosaminyl deacetylase